MIFTQKGNTLSCYGIIWSGDGTEFVSLFNRFEAEHDHINIRLHTQGGSVFDGNLMYNAISKSSVSVTLFVDGIAASMGAILLLSCGDVRIAENGYVMIHAPSGYSSGQAKLHEDTAKLLRLVEDNFKEKLQSRTGLSKAEVTEMMNGDNWYSAREALELGLVSEIVPSVVEKIKVSEEPKELGEMEMYNLYASLLLPTNMRNFNFQNQNNMYEELIEALNLQGVNAQSSKTAVIDAVKDLASGYKQEAENAKKELQDYKDKEITSLVANAKENGLIEDKDVATYTKIGKDSGVEALRTVLGAKKEKPQAPNIADLLNGGRGSEDATRAGWDFDTWQEKDARGLEAMADKEPKRFEKLLNAKYKK